MIINDAVFGELEYDYGWTKNTTIEFCRKSYDIALIVDGEEDGIFDKEQVNRVMKTQWIDVDCNVSKEQVAKGIELPPQTCANFHSTGCQFGAPQRLFNVSGPKSKPKAADT
jgi:hypothetical protein